MLPVQKEIARVAFAAEITTLIQPSRAHHLYRPRVLAPFYGKYLLHQKKKINE